MIWHPDLSEPWIVDAPENAVVILREGQGWTHEQSRHAAEQIYRATKRNVIVLAAGADLAVLSEDEMRKLGWCRCP